VREFACADLRLVSRAFLAQSHFQLAARSSIFLPPLLLLLPPPPPSSSPCLHARRAELRDSEQQRQSGRGGGKGKQNRKFFLACGQRGWWAVVAERKSVSIFEVMKRIQSPPAPDDFARATAVLSVYLCLRCVHSTNSGIESYFIQICSS
jgi:hypothetical protein